MKLRQFLSILGVVALVAVIYSPSSLDLSASPGGDGGTAPTDTSSSGTSMFVSYLHQSGYHVIIANDSQQAAATLRSGQHLAYVLVGADNPLNPNEVGALQAAYNRGTLSAIVAEGNTTNHALLATFGASTTGYAIVDPASTFQDKRVFAVDLSLGPTNVTGVIDIASPILLESSPLRPAATTSSLSYDSGDQSPGHRTVIAAGGAPNSTYGARIVVLSDSAPFTNFLFNYTQPSAGIDETEFVAAMLSYVDPGRANPVLLDASSYKPSSGPTFHAGLPIGPLVAYAIEQSLSGLNSYYASFPSQVSGALHGIGVSVSEGAAGALVGVLILISVYGAVARWFAPEKRGRDDRTPPGVERNFVAESRARTDFLETSRSKEGYVAALSQLYEVLDSIVLSEFGAGISSVDEGTLAGRVGADEARQAKALFVSLSKLREHALGERRLLFPPVIRWRALTERTTRDAEAFLNRLGMTITGEESSGQKMEPLVKGRVRA